MSKRAANSSGSSSSSKRQKVDTSSTGLSSWLGVPKPDVPSFISHSSEISDRDSTFIAHAATVTSAAQAAVLQAHIRDLHLDDPASHECLAWRCMALRKGRDGLKDENDFEVRDGRDDDGENKAGEKMLKCLEAEGAIDVAVVMSRWFGGQMLGPVRFTHIENVTTQAIRALQQAEELTSLKSKLLGLDEAIAKACLALPTPTSPGKAPDYSDLTVVKGNRLVIARTKRLEMLQKTLDKQKAQLENDIADILPPATVSQDEKTNIQPAAVSSAKATELAPADPQDKEKEEDPFDLELPEV